MSQKIPQFKSFFTFLVVALEGCINSFDMNKLPDQFKVGSTNEIQLYYSTNHPMRGEAKNNW